MMIQGMAAGELGLRMCAGAQDGKRKIEPDIDRQRKYRKEKTGCRGWIANERAEKVLGLLHSP